jgi:hypothetical protein
MRLADCLLYLQTAQSLRRNENADSLTEKDTWNQVRFLSVLKGRLD